MSKPLRFQCIFAEERKAIEKKKREPLSALCISGGGIRSATFALGVLQELARRGLLDQLDYLSTVSGGGYIGSWLSAYRHHQPKAFKELLEKPTSPVTTRPEPEPIQYLRAFSNYLTPRLGLFSADTWTIVSIYLRNLTLNWLVLIPALVALLLIPRFLFAISVGVSKEWLRFRIPLHLNGFIHAEIPVLALGWLLFGFAMGIFAIGNIGRNLPVNTGEGFDQSAYLKKCLLGLLLSALGLSTFWAEIYSIYPGESSTHFTLWPFLVFGAIYHLLGWSIGFYRGKGSWHEFWKNFQIQPIVAVIFAGLAGGFIAWLVVCVGFDKLFQKIVQNSSVPLEPAFANPYFFSFQQPLQPLVDIPKSFPDTNVQLFFLLYFCLATPLLLGAIGGAGILYVGWTTKSTTDEDHEWWARSGSWIMLACLGWMGLTGLVFLGPPFLWHLKEIAAGLLGGSGFIATLLGKSAKTSPNNEKKAEDKSWKTFLADHATTVAAPLFIVLFLALLALLSHWVLLGIQHLFNAGTVYFSIEKWLYLNELPEPFDWESMVNLCALSSTSLIMVSIAFMAGWSLLFGKKLDINRYSMQGMYRNRLVRAYLGASRGSDRTPNPFTGFDPDDDFPMSELKAGNGKVQKPLHIVNCALNLVGGKTLAWQQRKAMSFTVSPLHSGSCLLSENSTSAKSGDISIPIVSGCYRESKVYGDGITLGTAVGISGAAASPNMGYHSSPTVTFLLTLFNVRLGWWLGNPKNEKTFTDASPFFFLGTLFKELFGLTDADSAYVNLSDGGHFENLGLYEMVLRRCKLIIVSDAGADPDFKFEDLGNAIRKIRADQGVDINFKTVPIYSRHNETTAQRGYFAIGEIDYQSRYGEENGYLLYLKPTLKPDDQAIPADVRNYAAANKDFPHQSTGDQFFDESQFESYRALGEYVARESLNKVFSNPRPNHDLGIELLRELKNQF